MAPSAKKKIHDIILCVSNDLTADQRLHKMSLSLQEASYNVLLLGRKKRQSLHPGYRTYDYKRLNLIFSRKAIFYAEYNIRLLLYLLFHPYKLAIANDLDTLPAVWLAARLKNKKILFDSHELFSEVPELQNRPRIKNFWRKLEDKLIPQIDAGITVSSSIADYYLDRYEKKFTVLPNYPQEHNFIAGNLDQFGIPPRRKIMLYQGALNKSRGLELMINTMSLLPDWILVIAGTGDLEKELKSLAKKKNQNNQIIFTGQLNFETLQSLTPLANIGLSLEEDAGLNYRFALPNKIFDYVKAQIPVIVSDLPEMARIVNNFHVGEVLKYRTPEDLASLIKKVQAGNENIFYQYYLNEAARHFIWSNNQKKLQNLIKPLILQCN